MQHTNLKKWEFQWGEPSNFPMMKPEVKEVIIPHDFVIETDVNPEAPGGAENGFYMGNKASYTYRLNVEAGTLDRTRILYFDGVAGTMKLVVNGHTVGRHHYAYSPFYFDISKFLNEGNNRITVTINSTNEPNGRWYTGGGLYREVALLESGNAFIKPDGIFVRSEKIEPDRAKQLLTVELVNKGTNTTASLSAYVRQKGSDDWSTCIENSSIDLTSGDKLLNLDFEIANPKLWDIDEPNLYEIKVDILDEKGQPLDSAITTFGIRTIEINAKDGFLLNGKSILLKGGCIHHDNGILGAAAHRDAEYRKVRLHKDRGFNALRFAHNPMSKHLLNACDEMGVLVIDEMYDVWNMEKSDFDFSQYFKAEADDEMTTVIKRDRNHPSVFMWSIGNEIPEQGGLSNGYETSKHLAEVVRGLDDTRAVGGALCSFFRGLSDEDNQKYWQSIFKDAEKLKSEGMVNLDCEYGRSIWDDYTSPFVEDWDVVGYNYLQYHYESSHERHPDRVIICTESKPREFYSYWNDVKRLSYLLGDFEWTSMDYLGEASIGDSYYVDEDQVEATRNAMHYAKYPARTASSGDFDICGFEKPQLMYKRVVWGESDTYLVTHNPEHFGKVEILGRYSWGDAVHGYTWDAEAGSKMLAEVYSNADTVELIQNGNFLGKKKVNPEDEYKTRFEITYEPGELTAIGYDVSGNEISRDTLKSAGEVSQLIVKKYQVDAKGKMCYASDAIDTEKLVYLDISMADINGSLVTYAENDLSIEVADGKLLALGTGRSTTEENYTAGRIKTYGGRALAITMADAESGKLKLTVNSDGFNAVVEI